MGYRSGIHRTGEDPLTYDEIKRRALPRFVRGSVRNASELGQIIWPKNTMVQQGLGFAAARWIRKMQDDGLLSISQEHQRLVHVITDAGRRELDRLKKEGK
jgi:hypothetical protein